mgnify:CR=1 FL=1
MYHRIIVLGFILYFCKIFSCYMLSDKKSIENNAKNARGIALQAGNFGTKWIKTKLIIICYIRGFKHDNIINNGNINNLNLLSTSR